MHEPPGAIYQRWGHSREEDTGDLTVYRPMDFPFPPARGRDGIEFRPDGTFIEWRIGRGDASEGVKGHWRLETPGRMRVNFEMNEQQSRRLEIVESKPDILVVRQQPAGP